VRVAVAFRSFDEQTARAYVETGEPMDKAGAYGIQGYGATIVERIDGDFFAVMGFPIVTFIQLLERHGWHYDFGRLQQSAENGKASK
jgi:septum formation protein